ncbi:MAG: Do family serine endopeptidase [Chitinivibrionales bacterium]|nr:Do family serine endopeptidase [Chitinivibrionales bacterium]
MQKRYRRITVGVALAALVSVIYTTGCQCTFADDDRPGEGTIEFGAQKKPDIKQTPQFESFKTIFADIAEEVVPTVVSVIPTQIDTVIFSRNPFYRYFDNDQFGSPFDFFFGQPRRRQQQPPIEKQERRRKGLGSGVIVSEDGYILTNYHVIAGADEIEVRLSDDRTFEATIVGSDSLSDVAVIKIAEEVKDLPVAYLGDSDKLRPGDWTLAIGNPFSLTSTVTAGIVSALGRTGMAGSNEMYQNFIQTDAAINPGNSGGALVNLDGELIGINTMIYTRSGGYMGIGFAIPIKMARWIMEDLIYNGKVSRGWLGVQIQPMDDATREAMGLDKGTRGVLIADVFDGQPADKAGIKRGDIIVSIDGMGVENVNELRNTVASIDPGKKVPIEIIRNGKKKVLQAKLGERSKTKLAGESAEDEKEESADDYDATKKLGIKISELTDDVRSKYNIEKSTKGVVVVDLDRASLAAREGIQVGDVIKEVRIKGQNAVPVTSAKEFKKIVRGLKPGDSVMFLIERDGHNRFVAFRLRK